MDAKWQLREDGREFPDRAASDFLIGRSMQEEKWPWQ
jgi:hypothetical protein